jgi:hypothetical protein
MLTINRLPPLKEIFAVDDTLEAAKFLEMAKLLKPIILFQEMPDVALVTLSGIGLPPHQRTLLHQLHRGAGTNVIVASRGTAKSSTACALYATYKALLFPRRTLIELSATGFRGGQLIFADIEQWIKGGWDSQDPEVPAFIRGSVARPQILTKNANFWTLEFDSFSKLVTLPTKDPDAIRGQRGRELYIDEANTIDRNLIERVALPFLNVKGDFKHGGFYSGNNQLFMASTIDFNWRPFQDHIRAAKEGVKRDLMASRAMRRGDWEHFEEMDSQGLHEHVYFQLDYTDLLIRRHITTRDGITYKVSWPNPDIPLISDNKGIPFVDKLPDGRMDKRGAPVEYYRTYPLDKSSLERPLNSGAIDEASWLAEQRNIVDQATGDVYPPNVVEVASCRGDNSVIAFEHLGEAWQKKYGDEPQDYVAPLMWRCTDPCVLGVDYAPQSDFCAFIVIRLGPCAEGEFSPFTHHGKSEWSNVIWAEQHQKMTHKEAAEKIRELAERYHLSYYHDAYVDDPWEVCRAIGLDMRGGGSGVRDELCFINDEFVPAGKYRIYDPLDKDERISAYALDPNAKPMLDTIFPQDQLNDRMVEYTLGQMQQRLLFLGKYLDLSQRPRHRELYPGFDAVHGLAQQLIKLRQEPTKNYRTFYMDGDTAKVQNKKDLWSAFIYAAKQMRAHIIRQNQIDNTPPPQGAVVARVGAGRRGWIYGKAPGTRG